MASPTRTRTHWVRWVLLILVLAVPICEVALVVRIGGAIGGWQTLGLLIVWSVLGAWLVCREWAGAWRGLREVMRTGVMPADELADAALVLIGGLLILLPGFITDVVGLVLILPLTRPIGRRLLQVLVARRLLSAAGGATVIRGERVPPTYTAHPYDAAQGTSPGNGPDMPMAPGEPGAIEGKIVRDKRSRP